MVDDDACSGESAGHARRTAVRFSNAGIQTFGCLTPVLPAPEGVGLKFACTTA